MVSKYTHCVPRHMAIVVSTTVSIPMKIFQQWDSQKTASSVCIQCLYYLLSYTVWLMEPGNGDRLVQFLNHPFKNSSILEF